MKIRAMIGIAVVPLLAAAHCSRHGDDYDPSGGCDSDTVVRTFYRAGKELTDNRFLWRETLRGLTLSVGHCPGPGSQVADWQVDAEAIAGFEPGCEDWVRRHVFSKLVETIDGMRTTTHVATVKAAALRQDDRDVAEGLICPVLPREVDPGAASFARVYAFRGDAVGLEATITMGTSAPIALVKQQYPASPGVVFFDLPIFETCADGDIAVSAEGSTQARIPVRALRTPEPSCQIEVAKELSLALQYCQNSCCRYANTNDCVVNLCDAECEARNRDNPAGSPAIGDACSTSGDYYRWCHSYCAPIDSCRADWCDGAAPKLNDCQAQATQAHEDALAACPQQTVCMPPPAAAAP